MGKKIFVFLAALILAVGFVIRIIPAGNNNIYFTVDQGRDALYAREIVTNKRIFLKGPETSVAGIFAGPLWYYFVALGYFLFNGNPAGGVFVLIILNLLVTLVLMWQIGKHVSGPWGLLAGLLLQFFWWFYDTSRFAFNPFPLVAIAFFEILLLIAFLDGRKKYYPLALIPILFGINCEIAGSAAILLFYILAGVWGVRKKIISGKLFLLCAFGIPLLGGVRIVKELAAVFLQGKTIDSNTGLGVFTGTNFGQMAKEFSRIISYATIPQNVFLGLILFAVIVFIFIKQKKKNAFIKKFVYLTLVLLGVSFVFFGSNRGWRDWHTAYLPPLLFVSVILMLYQINRRIGVLFLAVIIIFQLQIFASRYKEYFYPSADPAILGNQLTVLDWIYNHNDEDGFNAYTYTKGFWDYQSQYLFWWYGRDKYGFLPCEYANFPLSHKELYVPGYLSYSEPKLGCDWNRFLIVESATNGQENKNWIDEFRRKNRLLEETYVGGVKIEKRTVRPVR